MRSVAARRTMLALAVLAVLFFVGYLGGIWLVDTVGLAGYVVVFVFSFAVSRIGRGAWDAIGDRP